MLITHHTQCRSTSYHFWSSNGNLLEFNLSFIIYRKTNNTHSSKYCVVLISASLINKELLITLDA